MKKFKMNKKMGEKITWITSSCSLLHECPLGVDYF